MPVGHGQLQGTVGAVSGKQALALYGPTRESALVTEAHALRYAK
jgi:hypothetical protein